VEDIADRADLARATFYAHYPNKEAMLLSVSNRLVEDLMGRIAYRGGPWNVVRRDAIQTACKHAAGKRGLYRAA
jgi:AcrR family transcriptional regulator